MNFKFFCALVLLSTLAVVDAYWNGGGYNGGGFHGGYRGGFPGGGFHGGRGGFRPYGFHGRWRRDLDSSPVEVELNAFEQP